MKKCFLFHSTTTAFLSLWSVISGDWSSLSYGNILDNYDFLIFVNMKNISGRGMTPILGKSTKVVVSIIVLYQKCYFWIHTYDTVFIRMGGQILRYDAPVLPNQCCSTSQDIVLHWVMSLIFFTKNYENIL